MRRALLASTVLGVAVVLGGCAGDPQADGPDVDDTSMGHIHGLGVNPADDTLYAATHLGLFRVDDGQRTRVADRWQDTMGFIVVGPDRFLASGHPDLREDLPTSLGLIESTDAGETWEPLALQGEADFHVLERAGDVLYAYDGTSGSLLSTRDQATFTELYAGPLLSVAAVDSKGPVLAADGNGRIIEIDPSDGGTRMVGGPPTVLLDAAPDGTVVSLDPDGSVSVSTDRGASWREVGSIGGQPSALTVARTGWYAATSETILRSTDDGRTWTPIT